MPVIELVNNELKMYLCPTRKESNA